MLHKIKRIQFFNGRLMSLLWLMIGVSNLTVTAQNKPKINNKKQLYELMANPHINFYDVKKAAETHFKNIDKKKKGSGFKQYQRWLYHNEPRFYPSGIRDQVKLGRVWQEVERFRAAERQRTSKHRTKAPNSTWKELGPKTWKDITGHWAPGIGRFTDIYVDLSNPNFVLAGTPSGGLWKTTNGGQTWSNKTDYLPSLGIAGIVVAPGTNNNTIYIATGDNERAWDTRSTGVLKSTDGGNTWQNTGLNWSIADQKTIYKLVMHPSNPNILLAAAQGGLYKTSNGGNSWTIVNGFASNASIRDVEFHPTNPNIVYATTDRVFRSTDGGNNFSLINSVPAASTSNRVKVAVTPANPNLVYAWTGTAMYRSSDSGASYVWQATTPNTTHQVWYDMGFAVSDNDPNEVHIGAVDAFRSFDGGRTWAKNADWWLPRANSEGLGYVHADIHVMKYVSGVLYVCSDGLVTRSSDKGTSFTDFTEGINNRQFYSFAIAKQNANKIVGGSQDNGTTVYTGGRWHEWRGADGGYCAVDFSNENIVYGCQQNAEVWFKSTNGGQGGGNVAVPLPQDNGQNVYGVFVTPYEMDHTNPNILYVGLRYGKVFKTTDGMQSWTKIGDFGGGMFDNAINKLAVAPSNSNYIYVSAKNKIWRTKNGGASWQVITNTDTDAWVNEIAVHPENPERVAIGYGRVGDGKSVYESSNAGSSWTNIGGTLPQIPANALVYERGANNALYVGMDVGIYYRSSTNAAWQSFNSGLPNTPISELIIHEGSQKLFASTFGRGIWRVDLYNSTGDSRPNANFSANVTNITVGGVVKFTDQSSNNPSSWNWSFAGGQVLTNTSYQSPSVAYFTPGTYQVSLTATNDAGSDTETKNGYIVVNDYNVNIAYEDFSPDHVLASNSNWKPFSTIEPNNNFGLFRSGGAILLETYGRTAVSDKSANIVPLNAGTLIAASSNWSSNSKPVLAGPGHQALFGRTSYVGVQLEINGNIHYGWLQVSVSADGQSVSALDFAYEQQAGVPIKAGAKTSTGGGNLPVASFSMSTTSPLVGQAVTFTNTSTNASSISWSFPNGNPANSTANNPSVTWNTAGTYTVQLTATNSEGSTTQTATITVSAPVNYCTASAQITTSEHITNVTLGSINNNTGSSGYGNYTSQSATVTRGSSQSFSITPSVSWSGSKLSIWVDWNQDGDFDDSGEARVINGTGTYMGSLSVPSNATIGSTRMRIRLSYGNALSTPCGNGWTGEVEDYTIVVAGNSTVNPASNAAETPHEIHVFPNPSNGRFKVAIDVQAKDTAYLRVLNTQGKVVVQQALGNSQYSDFVKVDKKGIYYVQIISGSGISTRKVVVK